jgi:hypothetical protein
MKIFVLCLLSVLLFTGLWSQDGSTSEILESFVNDFRADPAALDRGITFGIKVRDKGEWHVVADGKGGVELKSGMPPQPSLFYVTDFQTLRMIHRGEMSALTAMGRARLSDKPPLNFGFMPGFQPDADILGWGANFTFHFWTRGIPETVRFGPDTRSRLVHGAQAKILYYEKGLRSGWYQIRKGQHVNADPGDQKNSFPTLVIMINGQARARIGGKSMELKKGTCIHIPSGITHEFWNDREEPAEFIIVMFGKGA